MAKPIAKTRQGPAERAAEHFLREVCDCIATQRAVRTQWCRQDLFGADVMGVCLNGTFVFAQVTTGQHQAVTSRRRKLEAYPWDFRITDVLVLQLRETLDPGNRRKKLWHFRVHELVDSKTWTVWDRAVPVPPEWFKGWKPDNKAAEVEEE